MEAEGKEKLEALIAERDEEDAKLDEEMESSGGGSDAGPEDLLDEAEAPLGHVLQ